MRALVFTGPTTPLQAESVVLTFPSSAVVVVKSLYHYHALSDILPTYAYLRCCKAVLTISYCILAELVLTLPYRV